MFCLLRSVLLLNDSDGIDLLTNTEIFQGLETMGYVNVGTFVFRNNKFSKQCKFLLHTILHCLSSKHISWDQFGSKEAMALICLSTGQTFNWPKAIFEAIVRNVNAGTKKFLMYPRFL